MWRDAAKAARNAMATLRRPLYVPPGHFYSPLTAREDTRRAEVWAAADSAPGVDLREGPQLDLARRLAPLWSQTPLDRRYRTPNDMYPLPDAAVYSSLLRQTRPKRVVEVGSGWSSALALDTAERWEIDCEWTWVEPYPDRLLGLVERAELARGNLIRQPVQAAPLEVFDRLEAGDMLIVDSTHVVKAGSDVVWLMLHVFPRLAPGVLVHLHDVFWPFEYPTSWLREGRDWTEVYLLHAWLAFNSAWQVLLFTDWLWQRHPELVVEHLPAARQDRPGSIWLRRLDA